MGKATRAPNQQYTPLPKAASYPTFDDFYPFYLGEHHNAYCRRLHLLGTGVSALILTRVALSSLSLVPVSDASAWRLRDLFGAAGLRLAAGIRDFQTVLRLARPAWQYLAAGIGQGYLLAWVGHFFFEKNKPATFTHPLYSFVGDLRMLWEVVTFQRSP